MALGCRLGVDSRSGTLEGMLREAQELLFFFFFNTKKLSDMGVNFNHSHTMIKQII